MKTSKKELFLNFIKTQHDWIDSSTLANYLNVSTRSIRKYVNEINSNGEFILSSKKGYKVNLNNNCQTKVDSSENISPDNRLNLILKELIVNSNGINIKIETTLYHVVSIFLVIFRNSHLLLLLFRLYLLLFLY